MKFKFSLIIILVIFIKYIHSSEYPIPNYPYDITTADIDCDGDWDLLVGSNGDGISDTVSILTNNGVGYFNEVYWGHENYYVFNCAKLDGDNYPDLITALSNWYYCYYANDGFGNFNSEPDIFHQSLSEQFEKVKITDTNNDGDNDIIFYKTNANGYWGILHNNGYGEFTENVYFETEENIMHLDAGKINDDEYTDIVITTGDATPPRIFYDNGNDFIEDTLMIRNWAQCFIKDMNNDNLNDIFFFIPGDFIGIPCDFMIGYNIGNEEFAYGDTLELPPLSSILDITDFNNDNYPDIVYHSVIFDSLDQPDEENIFICFNNQDGTFSEADMYHIGPCMFGFKLTSADFDNNGYLDIAVTSRDLHHVRILFNDGTGSFMEEPQVEISNEELIINNCKLSNYPNPFNPATTINFNIGQYKQIELEIYNIKGEKIRQYAIQNNQSSIVWDGTDNYQNQVSSGVYLYRIKSDDFESKTKKMLLLK